jgi:hypothetical protein
MGNHGCCSATVAFVVIGECALLLSWGVTAAWGLLANSHEELLNVCKLVLHCDQAVSLALHGFLRGGIRGTKVCEQVTIQHDQHVVVHCGHTISMLQGQDSSLVEECNCVNPIFLEGVDCIEDQWDCVLMQDPIFILLGIHSTALDDAQANVDDVMVVHQVACSAGLGSVNEEARCEELETFREMSGVAAILCQFAL